MIVMYMYVVAMCGLIEMIDCVPRLLIRVLWHSPVQFERHKAVLFIADKIGVLFVDFVFSAIAAFVKLYIFLSS